MANTRAAAMSRNQIANLTQIMRKAVGLDNTLYFPIVHFIEILASEDDIDFNYELVEANEFAGTYATTNTSENVMYIREDVYERAVNGNPRDRFTLCHELGHYFLHRPETISNARGEVPKYCDPEWQANAFAGELMAPRNLIKGMDYQEIAKKCGMSMTAANIQYKIINRC